MKTKLDNKTLKLKRELRDSNKVSNLKFRRMRKKLKKRFLKRFGNETGTLKYKDLLKKIKIRKSSPKYYIDKFGEKEGNARYNRIYKIPYLGHRITEETCIIKYGENVGKKVWENYISNQKKSHSLEGMIEKLGKREGNKKYKSLKKRMSYINSQQYYKDRYGNDWEKPYREWTQLQGSRTTLKTMISNYGETRGTEKYRAMVEKKVSSRNYYSKISQELFNEISNKLERSFKYQTSSENKGELLIKGEDKVYKFDFCDLNKKKIIEFNGDMWHANPKKYLPDQIVRKGLTSREIWRNDEIKRKLAEANGFKILYIWESDFKSNRANVIENCIKFLEE